MSGGIILKSPESEYEKRKKTNIIMVLLFLFILPVMALIIGSKITEWWVIPTINTDDILGLRDETIFEEDGKAGGCTGGNKWCRTYDRGKGTDGKQLI